jgi:MFS family permease
MIDGRRSGAFGLLWTGQAVSQLGDYVALFAIPYFVFTISQDPLDFGLVHAGQDIPLILFGLFSGVLLDRWSRRAWLFWGNVVQVLVFSALALVADGVLPGGLWVLVATAFVVGAMTTALQSALFAYVPSIVGSDALSRANSRLSVTGQAAFIVGPVLGGFLVERFGFLVAFGFDALTFAFAAVTVAFLPRDRRPARAPTASGLVSEAVDGMRFIWNDRRLRLASLGAAASNVVSAFMVAILPLLAANQFASEAALEMSVIYGAFGVGGVVGALTGGLATDRLGLGRVFVVGLLVWGAGFAATTYLSTRLAVLVLFAVTGFGLPWVQIAFSTLRQKVTPEPMLGRVMAGTRAAVNAAYPIGAIGLTAVAAVVGEVPTSRVVPLMLVGVAIWLGFTALGSVGPDPRPLGAGAGDPDQSSMA